jgi:phenylacetate-CoA ligase
MLAFSFGPFIGFWAAQEAVQRHGALVLPGGGMITLQRLAMMRDVGATVLICTPSYALHLAEAAEGEGIDPARNLFVRKTIHAGEPGAGIPATRERIETLWGAQCFDHPGASEIGAYGFSCSARRGVHTNEAEFIAEVVNPETGAPVAAGEAGELVMTNLGRAGFPVVRFRSGDIVHPLPRHTCACGRTNLLLEGGILGRKDDMVTIRGVNVFPSAFLALFNGLPDIGEHRLTAYQDGHMPQLHVEYEDLGTLDRRESIASLIREKVGIRVSLTVYRAETLPRFEAKAKRFFDRRREDWHPPKA